MKNNDVATKTYSWLAMTVSLALIFSAILGGIASWYIIRDHRNK